MRVLLRLGSCFFFSFLGSCSAGCAAGFAGGEFLGHQGDLRHGGVVALAVLQLDDAGVATVAVGNLRRDVVEKYGDDLFALASVVRIAPCSKSWAARLERIFRWWDGDPPSRAPFLGVGMEYSPRDDKL